MKPIFNKELQFLQEYGIEIPMNCWRDGSKIYLNSSDLFPIIKFKVDEMTNKIKIIQNNIVKVEDNKVYITAKFRGKKYDEIWINKTFEQEIDENTMFLTLRECKEHIEANSYHYNKPHPYAMTAWRSPQVERLYKILQNTNWNESEVISIPDTINRII